MKKLLSIIGRVTISLILSGSALTGAVAVFHYIDPDFSIGFFDLLAQFSFPAWMVLLLATAVIFVILTRIPLRVRGKPEAQDRPAAKRKQSD